MLDEINTVDWFRVPGPPEWYEPERAIRGLRALSGSANLVQAAEAGSLLGGGGIVHDHSGAVPPAAAVAAPLLLDIVEQSHPAAQEVALGLLDEALSCYPHAGYTRVPAPDGTAVPLCCAIADHLRARSALLVRHGKRGRSLLAEAAAHWRFEVRECVADGSDTAAFGSLAGSLPHGAHTAEMHLADAITLLSEVTLEYPPADGSCEACLRVAARRPGELPPGAVLFSADCGDREH
ncbi:hypothetical protein ACIQAC_30480 [Streptomyces sp. NPDC088387]|uniref:hypothetical protein n=1 Tax=Streptomyces sp. NPDC088387 TaxID=3365859 RepID=UPI003830BB36